MFSNGCTLEEESSEWSHFYEHFSLRVQRAALAKSNVKLRCGTHVVVPFIRPQCPRLVRVDGVA